MLQISQITDNTTPNITTRNFIQETHKIIDHENSGLRQLRSNQTKINELVKLTFNKTIIKPKQQPSIPSLYTQLFEQFTFPKQKININNDWFNMYNIQVWNIFISLYIILSIILFPIFSQFQYLFYIDIIVFIIEFMIQFKRDQIISLYNIVQLVFSIFELIIIHFEDYKCLLILFIFRSESLHRKFEHLKYLLLMNQEINCLIIAFWYNFLIFYYTLIGYSFFNKIQINEQFYQFIYAKQNKILLFILQIEYYILGIITISYVSANVFNHSNYFQNNQLTQIEESILKNQQLSNQQIMQIQQLQSQQKTKAFNDSQNLIFNSNFAEQSKIIYFQSFIKELKASSSLFSNIESNSNIFRKLEKQYIPKQTFLLKKGQIVDKLIFVLKGKVIANIEEFQFNYSHKLIAELEYISQQPIQYSIQAESDCNIIYIPYEALIQYSLKYPKKYHSLCMIRDQFLIENFDKLPYKCIICNEKTHKSTKCNNVFYIPDITSIIKEYHRNSPTNRSSFIRRDRQYHALRYQNKTKIVAQFFNNSFEKTEKNSQSAIFNLDDVFLDEEKASRQLIKSPSLFSSQQSNSVMTFNGQKIELYDNSNEKSSQKIVHMNSDQFSILGSAKEAKVSLKSIDEIIQKNRLSFSKMSSNLEKDVSILASQESRQQQSLNCLNFENEYLSQNMSIDQYTHFEGYFPQNNFINLNLKFK